MSLLELANLDFFFKISQLTKIDFGKEFDVEISFCRLSFVFVKALCLWFVLCRHCSSFICSNVYSFRRNYITEPGLIRFNCIVKLLPLG